MILQEHIEELGSGILTIENSKVNLVGFTCAERLMDYYDKYIQCFFSHGIYDIEPLDFSKTQDNALFIINDKDKNTNYKYQFKLLKKDKIDYKVDGKPVVRTYKVRLCNYTNKYNYKDMDYNLLFDTKDDLLAYFKNRSDLNLTF